MEATKKKRRGNPGKGGNFEREMAKKLSLWASNGKHDDWIWRTSSSGARAKTRAKQGKETANSCGDLKPEHMGAFFLFNKCIWELKNGYKSWCVLDLIDNTKTRSNQKKEKIQTLESFAIQSKQDAKNAKVPYPIILTKKDKHEEVIWIPIMLFGYLESLEDVPYIYFSGNDRMDEYIAVNFDLFLEKVTPEEFEKAVSDT